MNPTRLTDMSFVPESDFVELVWENGQIQTSRARKIETSNNLLSQNLRIRDTENGFNAKMGKFSLVEPVLNEIPMSLPSVEMGLNQDDDMVSWLNCQINESMQDDYCSEFLNGLSGAIEHSCQNNFTSFDRRGGGNRPVRDSHTVFAHNVSSLEKRNSPKVSSTDRTGFSQSYSSPPQQNQTSFPYSRSRVLANHGDGVGNVNDHATSRDSIIIVPTSLRGFPSIKTPREVSALSTSSSSLINFPHFSKPAALVKANLQNTGMRTGFGRSSIEKMETKDKGPIASSSNPAEAMPLDSFSGLRKEMSSDCHPIVMSPKVSGKPSEVKSAKDLVLVELPDAVSQEDDSENDKSYCQNFDEGETKGQVDVEKPTEPVVASSSVCSANSVERTLGDPTQNLKRNHRDTEESEGPSEDVEEESVAVKKANPTQGGTGSKRSRAAEVHNLSERRRRDRINEKMRALQELIPNCNKVDKASMLDEAIEYLKTLQLQVQIMSMGAGFYVPPMMLTPGVPHMHAAHMAQFPPPLGFGMGMGMGIGFGMGIPDMNGGSSGCSMIQMPPMHGQQLPCSPVPAPSSLHGMGGSNLQMFGMSGQGLQMPVQRAPLMTMSGGPPLKSTTSLNVSGIVGPINSLDTALPPGPKDLIQNMKFPMAQINAASSPMNQTSSQVTNECFEQSRLVQNNGLASEAAADGQLKLVNGNDNRLSSEAAYCD